MKIEERIVMAALDGSMPLRDCIVRMALDSEDDDDFCEALLEAYKIISNARWVLHESIFNDDESGKELFIKMQNAEKNGEYINDMF